MGPGVMPLLRQCGNQEMDLQAQAEGGWLLGLVQGSLGHVGLHPASRVEYDETFGPMVKPGTIRTVLTLALSRA
jgi:hypothetical protein